MTSQVFEPTPKDGNRLSVYDGDQIAAENAWRHFTGELGYASIGVVAITVSECASFDLEVYADPEPFPEHAVIDFAASTKGQRKKVARQLRDIAQIRGWQYYAE